jgi:DNA-binding protein HU-beta
MNKAQLVAAISRDCGLTKVDINRVLDSFINHVTRALKKNEFVKLVGFGTFLITKRQPRRGCNPQSGAPIRIAGGRVPRFAPGKELKRAIKSKS